MTDLKKEIEDYINWNWDKEGMDEPNELSPEENREAVFVWFKDFIIPKIVNRTTSLQRDEFEKMIDEVIDSVNTYILIDRIKLKKELKSKLKEMK